MKAICQITLVALLLLPAALQAEVIYGITENQFLVSWESSAPGTLLSGMPVSGLQNNETVVGIDFRPATGELFALGSTSRLYTLSTASATVSMVGTGPFSPPINGTAFGFDFNPVIDRIRLDSDVDKNYVLNPNDGSATEVTDLFYGPGDPNQGANPNVVHAAYTNSALGGSASTQLYGVDSGLDILVTQANSAGTLGTVGSIGADITTTGGFDISGLTGIAYMAIEDADTSRTTFWTIDLGTGLGTALGEVGGGSIITALAVNPVPEPTAIVIVGAALIGTALRRKANR